jgi:integrase
MSGASGCASALFPRTPRFRIRVIGDHILSKNNPSQIIPKESTEPLAFLAFYPTTRSFHRFFRWCVGRGIIETNPATDLPKPGMARKRDRVLCENELVAVWRGAGTMGWPHGAAIRLLILTGARLQEVGQLRWSELDDGAIKLEGSRTKNGQPHAIPLSTAAQALLAKAPRIANSEFVFTMTGKRAISGWSVAKDRLDQLAPIASWVIHDFRRTVATGLQKLGVGLQVVESILGHVSGSRAGVVGIYQRHTYDAEKRAALEAWGAHVMGIAK